MIGGKENDKLFAQQQEKERQAMDPQGPAQALVILPDSQGHWELISDGESSFWDVYVRRNYPHAGIDCPYATNNNQTDPCMWLGGDDAMWRKISDEYQGRLAI